MEVENSGLKTEQAALREELRARQRATTPFSKGKDKTHPKQPGRKAGSGRFTTRPAPVLGPADIMENIAMPLNSRNCPQCAAALDVQPEITTVEDTPLEPVRLLQRFAVEVGTCLPCGTGRPVRCAAGAGTLSYLSQRKAPEQLPVVSGQWSVGGNYGLAASSR